jgi:1-pyrroline-5-carboxylate dehydrogenase
MKIPSWATVDPDAMGTSTTPYVVPNYCHGQWMAPSNSIPVIHPLDRDAPPIFAYDASNDTAPFVHSLRQVSKSGLHNPLKNPERYVQYGEISRQVR